MNRASSEFLSGFLVEDVIGMSSVASTYDMY